MNTSAQRHVEPDRTGPEPAAAPATVGAANGHAARQTPRKPNLIIAGAQKSGTTWLHRALNAHDAFFMSERKEIDFFNKPARQQDPDAIDAYLAHFVNARDEKYVAESTPHYLWVREGARAFDTALAPTTSAEAIARMLDDPRILLVLRDPASRAVSAFHHHFAMGRIDEAGRIDETDPALGIVDIGHYARHVPYWHGAFGSRLGVYLYDDLKADPRSFLSKLFGDLDVADDSERIADELAHRRINSKQSIISRNEVRSNCSFPRVTPAQIEWLIERYEEDIRFVETLLDRDLSSWRDAKAIEGSIVYRPG